MPSLKNSKWMTLMIAKKISLVFICFLFRYLFYTFFYTKVNLLWIFTLFFTSLICSAFGSFSDIVPPISWMVFLTFFPTSKCVRLALSCPLIHSLLILDSVCVVRKRFAASSSLPIWSSRFFPFNHFTSWICLTLMPYNPIYPASLKFA